MSFIQLIKKNSTGNDRISIKRLAKLCGVTKSVIVKGLSKELGQKFAELNVDVEYLAANGFDAGSAWVVTIYLANLGSNKAKRLYHTYLTKPFPDYFNNPNSTIYHVGVLY